ncbi:MAG: sensor histidine kinase [Alphaproteobacteria bacterium]|nr:sensor histidine kinase [Alphaproteobacteria bacterium]
MTTVAPETPAYLFLRRLLRVGFGPAGAVVFGMIAVAAGGITYAAFTGLLPESVNRTGLVPILLWVDLAVVLILAGLVAARLAATFAARRRGIAGARLHVRLVLLFVAMAVGPTVIVSTFAGYSINTSLQEWFNNRVRSTIAGARTVAGAYIAERQRNFEYNLIPLVFELRSQGPEILLYQERLSQLLNLFATQTNLSEVAIIDRLGSPVVRGRSVNIDSEYIRPSLRALGNAMNGAPSLLTEREDRISALVLLFPAPADPVFLYLSEPIDRNVMAQVNGLRDMVTYYDQLESQQTEAQFRVVSILLIIVVVFLLLAIWIGLVYAERLSRPITELVGAAERVRGGDLDVRVQEPQTENEIGMLSRAFNRMTAQLGDQRRELIDTNAQLNERRRLIEAVLSGVSAAVVSLDREGRVELANRAALDLLDVQQQALVGSSLVERLPQIGGMLELGSLRPTRVVQEEIEFRRRGETMTLLTRVAVERIADVEGAPRVEGFVVTFDDITELLSAQRKAAWADVARRIAHEIKNPLTPIQLSAERLKRKYSKQIVEDPETFAVCTDTIIRQVGDIGRMVDEFSSFARMPRPVLQNEDLKEICLQSVFLQRNAHPQIEYATLLPEHGLTLPIDRRQIGQALTNLLKNAAEAIDGRDGSPDQPLPQGRIEVTLVEQGNDVTVAISDNGRGLPVEHRARLTEPYVTTRAKGTGLGLAIVKKIMEDHGGYLILDDREGGGARISLVFRRSQAEALRTSGENSSAPKKIA